jgi:hypothetical protein
MDDEGGESRGIEIGTISYCAVCSNSAFWVVGALLGSSTYIMTERLGKPQQLEANEPLAKTYKEFCYLFGKATIGAPPKSAIEEFGKAFSGSVWKDYLAIGNTGW